jgi:hypothetical protein
MALEEAMRVLDNLGFTDVFLPFMLIFTILFAILEKIKIFGEGSRKFNGVIALAMSVGAIIPHSLGKYPPGADIVQILNSALPSVSLVIIAIVFLLVIIGIFGGNPNWADKMIGGWVSLIAVGLIVFIFGNSAGWWGAPDVVSFLGDPDLQATFIVIAVFLLIISIITKEDKAPETDMFSRMGKFFGAMESAKPPETKGPK